MGPAVHWRKKRIGTLFEVFDRFGSSQDWVVSRPLSGGLQALHLIDTGVAVGLCSRVGRRIVLEEQMFLRLQEDAESRMAYEALMPLEDRLHAFFETTTN